MTNFSHFDKPVIHFGSPADTPPAPAAPAPSLLHFGIESKAARR